MVAMPDDNRELSPITGYTRDHWLHAADAQLRAVRPFASPDHAFINLPGTASWSGPISDGLEGFARTFILAAFRVAGEKGHDPHGHLTFYRSGLIAGTDPGSAQPWPRIDVTRQALVEAASLVLGLHLSRVWLWDTLTLQEQDNVIAWLSASVGVVIPDNNWVMFKVMVQEFIASTGRSFEEEDITNGLARLEDWYVGDGWYTDGDGQRFDYYSGWAMQLYPVLWTMMAKDRVPELAALKLELYRDRLRSYLERYVRFFGTNGAPVFQGRSLMYRFGATAPLWLGEMLGVTPVEPGVSRRLASGALRYFNDGGAFDENGLLHGGWFGAFGPMVQSYSGPASPYWTSKGFLGLLLPADHPVWTAQESPAPVEISDFTGVLAAPGFVLSTTKADGVVRLANHGSDNQPGISTGDDPHYSRFAFSSHTAPDFRAPLDNHIAVIDAHGEPSRRTVIHRRTSTTPDTLVSAHRPVWGDDDSESDSSWTITSATAVRGPWELRVHVVESQTGTTAILREGGYAVGTDACEKPVSSWLLPVLGYEESGAEPSSGTNPMAEDTLTPWLRGVHSGNRSVTASLVVLSGDPAVAQAVVGAQLCPELVETEGLLTLSITAPDGEKLTAGFRL
ncbi:DUF2264 domain-containing protein [Arthrobacter sp. GMC3]|uniref:DUF2264 domain-containing protein n=1 Tax=Arthrobacter sp. GMC3 TaxID=2058894 RepID=UPI000CE42BC0|nr:DUF2264 domain-containing protein [Arthrobacter sp. GMC3]